MTNTGLTQKLPRLIHNGFISRGSHLSVVHTTDELVLRPPDGRLPASSHDALLHLRSGSLVALLGSGITVSVLGEFNRSRS
jgi:hypothetical protein